MSDINPEGADEVAKGIDGISMELDVSDREAVDNALDSTVAQLGSLDILVCNAGVYAEYGGPVGDISDEMWRKLWSVNVDGVFCCCRAAAGIMIKADRGGRITNIASTQPVTPGVGVTYDGLKAAIVQITRAWRWSWLHMGLTSTHWHLARLGFAKAKRPRLTAIRLHPQATPWLIRSRIESLAYPLDTGVIQWNKARRPCFLHPQ